MATVGTIAGSYDVYRNFNITIANFNIASNTTPSFRSLGFVIGSWALEGTLTTPSVQLQGSNDNVNFFNIGTAATVVGINTMTTPTNMVPIWYQFAGTGTGTATIIVTLMSTFG